MHQLMNIWVVSTSGLLWIVLLGDHFRSTQIHLSGLEENSKNPTLFPSTLCLTPLHRCQLHSVTVESASMLSAQSFSSFTLCKAAPCPASLCSGLILVSLFHYNHHNLLFKCLSCLFFQKCVFLKDRRPSLLSMEELLEPMSRPATSQALIKLW